MDPNTLNLIIFAEGLAALAAKAVADVRSLLSGSATKTADEMLADADATYQALIAK